MSPENQLAVSTQCLDDSVYFNPSQPKDYGVVTNAIINFLPDMHGLQAMREALRMPAALPISPDTTSRTELAVSDQMASRGTQAVANAIPVVLREAAKITDYVVSISADPHVFISNVRSALAAASPVSEQSPFPKADVFMGILHEATRQQANNPAQRLNERISLGDAADKLGYLADTLREVRRNDPYYVQPQSRLPSTRLGAILGLPSQIFQAIKATLGFGGDDTTESTPRLGLPSPKKPDKRLLP